MIYYLMVSVDTQTHTHIALCFTDNVRNSAWHLAVRRRVLCRDARCGDTLAAVSHTMGQCVCLCVSICILSACVCIHASCTNPSMSWESVCVHGVRMPACLWNCVLTKDVKLPPSPSAPSRHHADAQSPNRLTINLSYFFFSLMGNSL